MIFLLSLLFSLSAMARSGNGNVVGNGGNTVRCEAPLGSSPVLARGIAVLDVVEGMAFNGYHYQRLLSLRGLSLAKAFPRALSQFLPYSAFERSQLSDRFQNMSREVSWQTGAMPELSTSSRLSFERCALQQAAVQYGQAEPVPGDAFRLLLSRPLWEALPTDQKVALLFHEFLLKDRLLMHGGCTVDEIRELVGFLLSDEALIALESAWRGKLDQSCSSDPLNRG